MSAQTAPEVYYIRGLFPRDSRGSPTFENADPESVAALRPCCPHAAGICIGGPPPRLRHFAEFLRALEGVEADAVVQGLTLVHISAQRKHFMRDSLGGFSDENGSG